MEALFQGLAPLPADARQSITFDRGTAFSAWKRLKAGIGAEAWFRDPQAPYKKAQSIIRTAGCADISPHPRNRRR
jgi:transposase, IS30 family